MSRKPTSSRMRPTTESHCWHIGSCLRPRLHGHPSFRYHPPLVPATALTGEWQAKLSSAPTAAFLFGDFCNKICQQETLARLFDHLVRDREQVIGHVEAERFDGVEVDDQLEPRRLHDRQVGGLGAFEDSTCIDADFAVRIGKDSTIA